MIPFDLHVVAEIVFYSTLKENQGNLNFVV